MTYKDNFVAEIKCNGQILRSTNGEVYLPFNSEYSIYLKNLNSKKASIQIQIDGEDVLNNKALILDANSSLELEGFLKGTVAKNRFKFIEKTKEVKDYRGDRIDDGLIRIEFAFEKQLKLNKIIDKYQPWDSQPRYFYKSNDFNNGTSDIHDLTNDITEIQCSYNSNNLTYNSDGITVKGSICQQNFSYGSIGILDPSEVIVLQLKGTMPSGPVKKAVTTKTKLICPTCGKKSNSSFQFCPQCGTFLE